MDGGLNNQKISVEDKGIWMQANLHIVYIQISDMMYRILHKLQAYAFIIGGNYNQRYWNMALVHMKKKLNSEKNKIPSIFSDELIFRGLVEFQQRKLNTVS